MISKPICTLFLTSPKLSFTTPGSKTTGVDGVYLSEWVHHGHDLADVTLSGQKAMCAEPDTKSPTTPFHWSFRVPNVPSATRYRWKSNSRSLDIFSSRSMDSPKQQYVSGNDLNEQKHSFTQCSRATRSDVFLTFCSCSIWRLWKSSLCCLCCWSSSGDTGFPGGTAGPVVGARAWRTVARWQWPPCTRPVCPGRRRAPFSRRPTLPSPASLTVRPRRQGWRCRLSSKLSCNRLKWRKQKNVYTLRTKKEKKRKKKTFLPRLNKPIYFLKKKKKMNKRAKDV